MKNDRFKKSIAIIVLGLAVHNSVMFASDNTAALNNFPDHALVQPVKVVLDHSISEAQSKAQVLAARRYYTFWHTGDARLASAALDDNFKDLNLPQGRLQGKQGPLQASQQFRSAVPDLKVAVTEMLVVGDKVIGRLHFTGRFTGQFMGVQGKGQAIDFSAVDIYRIADGKIVENWHLEDNLTLLQQLGVVTIKK